MSKYPSIEELTRGLKKQTVDYSLLIEIEDFLKTITKDTEDEDFKTVFWMLFKQFRWVLTKDEITEVIAGGYGSKMRKMFSNNLCPHYYRTTDSMKGTMLFNTYYVAKFLVHGVTHRDMIG